MARTLEPRDRVRVYGGYDAEPHWLTQQPNGFVGTVERFVEDPNGEPAAVIELEREITLQGASSGETLHGRHLLLTFAWTEMDWSTPGPRLHVCLFRESPIEYPSESELHQGWVESHASWDFADGHAA